MLNEADCFDYEKLIGRQEFKLDDSYFESELKGQSILVTGAGGTIGSEICRQVLEYQPAQLLLLGHGENSIYQIHQELMAQETGVDLRPLIADIKDQERLIQIFTHYQPDLVYHAAAHKHVPLMELNPREALTNNVLGTYRLAQAVDQAGIAKLVMVSTDKAVDPKSVMGASKRLAELIIMSMNQESSSSYSVVRFGNVIGSRGSVALLFADQIAQGGPVTLTDFEMTRYFMTVTEASQLVLYAGAHADNGGLFILDMGEPVQILDLARAMIQSAGYGSEEILIQEVGLRPGEKLHEKLFTQEELTNFQLNDHIYVGQVQTPPMEELEGDLTRLSQVGDDHLKEAMLKVIDKYVK